MTEPSNEAVHDLTRCLYERSTLIGSGNPTPWFEVHGSVRDQMVADVQRALDRSKFIISSRQRWEQEVRERLLKAIDAVKLEAIEARDTGGIGASERIRQEAEAIFGEAEPVEGER